LKGKKFKKQLKEDGAAMLISEKKLTVEQKCY
jgi:hypothetical protein